MDVGGVVFLSDVEIQIDVFEQRMGRITHRRREIKAVFVAATTEFSLEGFIPCGEDRWGEVATIMVRKR